MANMVRTVIHADLSDGHQGEDYHLWADGERYALKPHTHETRVAARQAAPHLAEVPDHRLTHFTDAFELRDDCAVRIHLNHSTRTFAGAEAEVGPGNVAMYVPPAPGSPPVHLTIDYRSTVKTMLFHHPDLMSQDPGIARIIYEHMEQNPVIDSLIGGVADIMSEMGPPRSGGKGWAKLVPFTPPKNPATGMDGKTTRYKVDPAPAIKLALAPILTQLLKAAKNDHRLEGKKWHVQEGKSVTVQTQAPHAAGAAATNTWTPTLSDDRRVHGLETSIHLVDATKRTVRIRMQNYFIRFLGAYIRFWDANGQAIAVPDWKPDSGSADVDVAREIDVEYQDMHYIGYLGPIDNIFAVPIDSEPGELNVDVSFPENAVSATIYGSGLGSGRNEWPKSPIVGGILTGFINLGIPGYMLAAQVAAAHNKIFYDNTAKIMKSSSLRRTLLAAGMTYFVATAIEGHADFHTLIGMSNLLFNEAATDLLLAVEETVATQKVLEAVPFAGWVLLAIEIAVGAAQIAQTIMEVSSSPWNIENKVATTITSTVTIHPDPRHLAFPQGENASYTVRMIH